jgi:hypothetical protein
LARAEVVYGETKRNMFTDFKLGAYKPLIDREASLTRGSPYRDIFGDSSMLMFEIGVERFLWQKFGALGLGLSVGYAEKYGAARLADDPAQRASESTGLKVLPIRMFGVYRLDYPALHLGIPLVPYGKAGLVATPWWVTKGGKLEFADGKRGAGIRYGYALIGGLALMLDFLEPRLAKDFTADMGVAHSYLFAEYIFENVNNYGKAGLDLSSRHFMFGFGVDY